MSANIIRSDENNVSHPNYEQNGNYSNGIIFYGGNHQVNDATIDLGGFVVFELKYSTDQTSTNEYKWLKYQALNHQKAVSMWTKKDGDTNTYYNDQFNPDYQTNPSPILVDSIFSKPFFLIGLESQNLLSDSSFLNCINSHVFSDDATANANAINKVKAYTSELFNIGTSNAHDYEIVRKEIILNDSRSLGQYYTAPAGKTATIIGVETCASVKEFITDCSLDSANEIYEFGDYYPIPMSSALSSCNDYENKTNYDSTLNYNYYSADLYDSCQVQNSSIGSINAVYFKVE